MNNAIYNNKKCITLYSNESFIFLLLLFNALYNKKVYNKYIGILKCLILIICVFTVIKGL